MKLKLKRIAPLQAGKVLAVFYLLLSVMFLPGVMAALAMIKMTAKTVGASVPLHITLGLGVGLGLLLPLIYGAIGFAVGMVGAFVYNFIAKWSGGFELEFEADAPPPVF